MGIGFNWRTVKRVGLAGATAGQSEMVRLALPYVKKLGKAVLGPPMPSTAPFDEDRGRAIGLGSQFMGDRNNATEALDRTHIDANRGREQAALGMMEQQAQQMRQGPSQGMLAYQAAQGDIAAQQMAYAGQQGGTAGVSARRDAMANIAQQRSKAALGMAQVGAQEDAAFQTQRLQATDALAGRFAANRQDEMSLAAQARGMHNSNRNALGGQALQASGLAADSTRDKFDAQARDAERIRQRNQGFLDSFTRGVSSFATGGAG